jgi:TPR repeat protein
MPVDTMFLEAVKTYDIIENLINSGHYSWETFPPLMIIKMHSVFRKFFEGANRGHMLAQHGLSLMYYIGQGVKQDFKEAAKWYRKAADQGDAEAQSNLGTMYKDGLGVKQNFKEAVKWY